MTAQTGSSRQSASSQDLFVAAVPGAMSSLLLDAAHSLPGLGKVAVATVVGAALWLLMRRGRADPAAGEEAPADGAARPNRAGIDRRGDTPADTRGRVGSHRARAGGGFPWRWTVVGLATVTVLLLAVTIARSGRPSPVTAAVSLLALAVLDSAALVGRRMAGVVAAALSGGVIGLCLAITFWPET